MKLFKKIVSYFGRAIDSLENSRAPFIYFILTFLFAITLRNFLEIFSDNLPYISRDLFIHYDLSYVALAMILILLFHVLTKTDVVKIAKTILPAFIILTLVPIIDLILSKGQGYHLTYMLPGVHDDLLFRFFTLFGKFDNSGATPGIKAEIIICFLGGFLYFYYKKPNLIKNIFSTISVYVLLFCLGSTPFIIKGFLEIIGLEYEYSDRLFINFYLLVIFLTGILLFFLAKRKYFKLIIKDVSFFRAISYESMFFLGLLLGTKYDRFQIDTISVFYFIFIPISIFLAGLFSTVFNNIADQEIDKISNKERPLVNFYLTPENYKKLGWLFFGLALIYALAINFQTFFIILLFMGNYFLYSMPPFRLKRIPFFSKLFISLNALILIILGFITITGSVFEFPKTIIIVFLISATLIANFIDIKDYEGDKKAGIKTLPVILGLKNSKILIGSFFIPAYLSIYFLIKELQVIEGMGVIVYLLIFGIIQFYLINRRNYSEKSIFLASFLFFAFFIYLIYLAPFHY